MPPYPMIIIAKCILWLCAGGYAVTLYLAVREGHGNWCARRKAAREHANAAKIRQELGPWAPGDATGTSRLAAPGGTDTDTTVKEIIHDDDV